MQMSLRGSPSCFPAKIVHPVDLFPVKRQKRSNRYFPIGWRGRAAKVWFLRSDSVGSCCLSRVTNIDVAVIGYTEGT